MTRAEIIEKVGSDIFALLIAKRGASFGDREEEANLNLAAGDALRAAQKFADNLLALEHSPSPRT